MKLHFDMAGYYRCEVLRSDLSVKHDTGWFPNLITDAGLDKIATELVLNNIHVGTGSATPTTSDTGLQSWLAAHVAGQSSSTAAVSSPYYGSRVMSAQFGPGEATGNISELGIGNGNLSSSILFSRALVLDGGGSPTTITILADEYLRVYYELRYYAPLTDVTSTVSISGTSYDLVLRAALVTTAVNWASLIGGPVTFSANDCVAYTGDIGAITGSPAGSVVASASVSTSSYSAGTHQRDGIMTFDLSAVGTIKSVQIGTTMGYYQCSFTDPIAKTGTQVLTLKYRVSWARKTLP